MRIRTVMAGVVAGAALAAGAFAAPAQAADGKQLATDAVGPGGSPTYYCTYGTARARGCFAPHGEWFRIEDTMVDGAPVVIDWKFFDDEVSPTGAVVRKGRIWHTAGSASGPRYMNKSFPENQPGVTLKTIVFRACSGNYPNNSVSFCSEWISVGT
ncbi:hypothetical protein [Micromonospora lutea]|uniref:Secreted protein n=1 Tax=Micromonospora lutea TaxID=419825 RepID=A0ABQ4IXX7_9ACTN|nr:hypothetical protein [Micromonospora lutea]GIJ22782.1 hypothetical protein Vlu01_34060 [Micromonospora lutea]